MDLKVRREPYLSAKFISFFEQYTSMELGMASTCYSVRVQLRQEDAFSSSLAVSVYGAYLGLRLWGIYHSGRLLCLMIYMAS